MKCSECNSELLLDHVKESDHVKDYWYTCINPKCKRKGIAFRPSGEEAESEIKPAK